MAPRDLAEARDLRGGFGEETGEAPQCLVSVLHAARPQHAGDLFQVAAHHAG